MFFYNLLVHVNKIAKYVNNWNLWRFGGSQNAHMAQAEFMLNIWLSFY